MSKIKRFIPSAVIALGAAVAALLFATGPSAGVNTDPKLPRLVRTIRASESSHRIAVKAYGTSQADQEWTAIAEVKGRVTSLAEMFDNGEVLQKDTLVATIDKLDYELALKTAQTEVKTQEQRLTEVAQSKANIESVIELRQQQVDLAKADVDRLQTLLDKNASSRADFERAATSYLESQSALQNLKNELELIPVKQKSAETALEAAKLRATQAERDIERCEIRMPFTGLCVDRATELHQQLALGTPLGTFLSVDRAQVVAMVEARRAMTLLPNLGEAFGVIDLRSQSTSLVNDLRKHFELLSVPVDITWRAGEGVAQWRGRLARVSATVDQQTRAIPMIVEVDNAFTEIKLGQKPALVPDMFLEVVIYGDLVENVFVLPRDVIRDNQVYVVRDGKLEIVAVQVASLEDELGVIDSGLIDGDQVVLADLFPAANGMPLRVQEVENPVEPRLGLPELAH